MSTKITYKTWPDRDVERTTFVGKDHDQWQRYRVLTLAGRLTYVVWHEGDQCWYEEPERVTDASGKVWENHGFHSDDFLAFGGHESHIVEIAKGLLPEGGTFVDVGAHVGLFSVNMAFQKSQIVAFEANPTTYQTLVQNFRNNPTNLSGWDLRNAAVWDVDDEELNLVEVRGMETGGSTHCAPREDEDANAGSTKSVTLDTALTEYARVDLIKIDVEGAEARVLRGASKILTEKKPTLLIEMHDRVEAYDLPTVRAEVIEILESHNYKWDDSLVNGTECYYIVARPSDSPESDLGFEIDVVKGGEV